MTDTTDRPLVTLALFAYNQAPYIREAVEGALSQTYSPLEIIFSDDCSSDRTFEIMKESVRDYAGPHSVILRRSERNRGILGHINDVANELSGDIVVMAAGDDISLPHRVERLMDVFRARPAAFSVCSDIAVIGETVPPGHVPSTHAEKVSIYETVMAGGGVGLGAAYAYRKECFFWPENLPEHLYSEDRILPLRAALLGECLVFPDKLVLYRKSDTADTRSASAILAAAGRISFGFKDHVLEVQRHLKMANLEKRLPFLKAWKSIILIRIMCLLMRQKPRSKLLPVRVARRAKRGVGLRWLRARTFPERGRIKIELGIAARPGAVADSNSGT